MPGHPDEQERLRHGAEEGRQSSVGLDSKCARYQGRLYAQAPR